ncbi:MAG: hypothetical protein QM767_10240 [Anaeromyxobacter sp.]
MRCEEPAATAWAGRSRGDHRGTKAEREELLLLLRRGQLIAERAAELSGYGADPRLRAEAEGFAEQVARLLATGS